MATYDQLPVYKATYDLLVELFHTVGNFSKEHKFTLGERLKKEVMELMVNIYRANIRQDKKPFLATARENVEIIRLFLRLCKDLKQITLKKFIFLNELIESVSKQIYAWEKSTK